MMGRIRPEGNVTFFSEWKIVKLIYFTLFVVIDKLDNMTRTDRFSYEMR